MNDASTSEKAGQLIEDINILFEDVAGHPRVERKLSRIRSMAIDLQGRILHLEEKADAESESITTLYDNALNLRRELAACREALESTRSVNEHLQSIINQQPSPEVPHAGIL